MIKMRPQVGMTEFNSPQTAPKKNAAWMLTFTDLVSLLLTFFVMLFSMATVQIDKWDAITDSLSTTLNPQQEKEVVRATAQYNISTVFRQRAINLEYLQAVLEEKVADDPVLSQTLIQLLPDRLVLSLPGDLLFAAGQATLTPRAEETMIKVGDVLRHVSNQIVITGHTDPRPSSEKNAASLWEESLFRAMAVADALKQSGFTQDVLTYGYGDGDFENLPDLPLAQKQALARRVDIMVLQIGVGQ